MQYVFIYVFIYVYIYIYTQRKMHVRTGYIHGRPQLMGFVSGKSIG